MLFNKKMGGMDKMDSLIGFYCMIFRSKKWCHRVFFHYVDVCIVNAWLLYKRDMGGISPESTPMNLYKLNCKQFVQK